MHRSRALSAPLVAAALLAAAPANAQDLRELTGTTSQGRPASLLIDGGGLVAGGDVGWETRSCSRRRATFSGTTAIERPLDASTPDRFVYADRVVSAEGRFVSTIRLTVRGRRTGADRWRGTIRASVLVRRDGKRHGTCRLRPVRWTVGGSA